MFLHGSPTTWKYSSTLNLCQEILNGVSHSTKPQDSLQVTKDALNPGILSGLLQEPEASFMRSMACGRSGLPLPLPLSNNWFKLQCSYHPRKSEEEACWTGQQVVMWWQICQYTCFCYPGESVTWRDPTRFMSPLQVGIIQEPTLASFSKIILKLAQFSSFSGLLRQEGLCCSQLPLTTSLKDTTGRVKSV